MEKKSMKGYLYLMPALIIMMVFTIYPLAKAVIMSFYENTTSSAAIIPVSVWRITGNCLQMRYF